MPIRLANPAVPCFTWGMKRKRGSPFRVLAALSMETKAARGMSVGILRYAATHRRCEVVIAHSGVLPRGLPSLGDWTPDGLINGPIGAEAAKRPFRVGAEVFLLDAPDELSARGDCGVVLCDDAAAGRLAASLFVRRNLRHFGFVGDRRNVEWSQRRGVAFAGELRQGGHEAPSVFEIPEDAKLPEEEKVLADWLASLPKPCGVFAATDWRAKRVLDVCRAAGIDVPGLVEVVGVDNEEYVCEQCVPTLTSIEPDFEQGGYEAMELLDALLSGKPLGREARIRRYGMRGIVERVSTRDNRGTARIVNLALDFIRLHGASGGTAADVVKAAGCSASLLQRHFRKAIGRTVVQEIQRVRLEKACHLLRHTETPINGIGHLCGYDDESWFRVLFRKTFGVSMRDYRNRALPPGRKPE